MSIFAVTADYDVQFNNYAVPIGLISVFANRSFAETSSLTIHLKYWSLNQPFHNKRDHILAEFRGHAACHMHLYNFLMW